MFVSVKDDARRSEQQIEIKQGQHYREQISKEALLASPPFPLFLEDLSLTKKNNNKKNAHV